MGASFSSASSRNPRLLLLLLLDLFRRRSETKRSETNRHQGPPTPSSEDGDDPRPVEAKIDPPSSSPSETSPPETLDTSPPLPNQTAQVTPEGDSTEASAGEGVESQEEGEGEEECECRFCTFIKAGGCKDPFVAWKDCIEEAQKTGGDPVDKCAEVTFLLKKCMDKHSYCEPIIRAEKATADDIAAEKDEAALEQNGASSEKEAASTAS